MATDEHGSPRIFLGQAPLFHSQLRELEILNVQGIVNLCDEYKGLHHVYRKKGISLLWLKTVAHLEPTVEAMRTAVSFIEHHRKRGGGVYIHCQSGRGRSAAVVMAWLMQVKRMRPLEANQHLLRVRKVRDALFLQRSIIRFYEDLQSSLSLESVARARRAAAACRRAELQREATDSSSARGHHTNGSGGQRDGARARDGACARDGARTLSFATPWRHDSRQEDNGARVGFGLSAAPPNWDARDGARGGVWEIDVAPSEPAIPNSLPASALEQLEQYTRQRQQYMLALPTPLPTPLPSPRSHGDALGDAQDDALRTFSSFRLGRSRLPATAFGAVPGATNGPGLTAFGGVPGATNELTARPFELNAMTTRLPRMDDRRVRTGSLVSTSV